MCCFPYRNTDRQRRHLPFPEGRSEILSSVCSSSFHTVSRSYGTVSTCWDERELWFLRADLYVGICSLSHKAVPELRRLVAGLEPRSGHVGFAVDKVALGKVSSESFGSPANSHSTYCYTLIIFYHPVLVQ
jgi:hypothetical protein